MCGRRVTGGWGVGRLSGRWAISTSSLLSTIHLLLSSSSSADIHLTTQRLSPPPPAWEMSKTRQTLSGLQTFSWENFTSSESTFHILMIGLTTCIMAHQMIQILWPQWPHMYPKCPNKVTLGLTNVSHSLLMTCSGSKFGQASLGSYILFWKPAYSVEAAYFHTSNKLKSLECAKY